MRSRAAGVGEAMSRCSTLAAHIKIMVAEEIISYTIITCRRCCRHLHKDVAGRLARNRPENARRLGRQPGVRPPMSGSSRPANPHSPFRRVDADAMMRSYQGAPNAGRHPYSEAKISEAGHSSLPRNVGQSRGETAAAENRTVWRERQSIRMNPWVNFPSDNRCVGARILVCCAGRAATSTI